jgi:hypothetical protein
MRKTAGYTWIDYKTKKEILKWLNITQVLDKTQEYRRHWLKHLKRILKNLQNKRQKKKGRPLKRLLNV